MTVVSRIWSIVVRYAPWLLTLALHVGLGLFVFYKAKLAHHFAGITGYTGDTLNRYLSIAWVCQLVAIGHALAILVAIARLLTQGRRGSMVAAAPSLADRLTKNYRLIRGGRYVIEHHFVEIVQGLQLVEVAMQMYQANKLSRLVPTVWLNRLLAFVIVVNCWFTPIVHMFFKRFDVHRIELIKVLCDLALDITYTIVIPVTIFLPYYLDWDPKYRTFNDQLNYFRDTWYINAGRQWQQLMILDWSDVSSTGWPSVMLLGRAFALEQAMFVNLTKSRKGELSAGDAGKTNHGPITALMPGGAMVRPVPDRQEKKSSPSTSPQTSGHLIKVLDALLVVWGFVVAIIHLQVTWAAIVNHDRACLLETRPWGSTKYTCAVLEISCAQKGLVGTEVEMDDALRHVDPDSLQKLIVSHCPALEIPPRIQTFRFVVDLKVFNSTLKTWSAEAALHKSTNPLVEVLYFAMVNMTTIPPGLMADDFPPFIYDVKFCVTDLVTLPANLHEKWTGLLSLMVAMSPQMTTLPQTVLDSKTIETLIFDGNSMTALPEFPPTKTIPRMFFDGNPIVTLPQSIGSLATLFFITFNYTLMTEIPAVWYDPAMYTDDTMPGGDTPYLVMTGTPYCAALRANATTTEELDQLSGGFMVGWFGVLCGAPSKYRPIYPLEAEIAWRQVNLT